MQNKDDDASILEIFSKFALDHREPLAAVGVIATVTALFLNLDVSTFPEGLRQLQFVLLLFLMLSLGFLVATSFMWVNNKTNSLVGGLVLFTFLLLLYRLGVFIAKNFYLELQEYMLAILLTVMYIIYIVVTKTLDKIEIFLTQKNFPRIIIRIAWILCFLYFFGVFSSIYMSLSLGKTVSWEILLVPITNYFNWILLVNTVAASIFIEFVKPQKLWQKLLLFSPVIAYLIYITYDLFILIFQIFKS